MVMEYMDGGSLQDVVLSGGTSSELILCRLATSILHGLKQLHGQRMVHRDIKPHNLLLNHRGDIKISDFGLARTLNEHRMYTKTFVGTLLYMAPERIGGCDYGCAADIWSFGLVFLSVALGKYPLPTQDGFFGLVDSVRTYTEIVVVVVVAVVAVVVIGVHIYMSRIICDVCMCIGFQCYAPPITS
jgi:serine/threonine protein kinase